VKMRALAALLACGLSAETALAAPLRVVAFGTSLTLGGHWQQPLADRLAASTGCAVQVFTVARAGAPSTWGLSQLDRVAALRPDAVIVEFAINDAHLRQGLTLGRSVSQMRVILTRLAAATQGGPVVLTITNPVHGIGQTLRRPRLEAYYNAHAALAWDQGAVLADLRPAWRVHIANAVHSALPDGLHPSKKAAQAVLPAPLARALAPRLAGCRSEGA
jgi:acyl-CoA thioesterase-1